MLTLLLLSAVHLAQVEAPHPVLRDTARTAPEVCTMLNGRGQRAADDDDIVSNRPISEDTANVLEALKDMKPVGGVANDAALGLLGALADQTASEGDAESLAAAEMIRKFAPGSADRSKRASAREALGCSPSREG
jgi:hypothetical protein